MKLLGRKEERLENGAGPPTREGIERGFSTLRSSRELQGAAKAENTDVDCGEHAPHVLQTQLYRLIDGVTRVTVAHQ